MSYDLPIERIIRRSILECTPETLVAEAARLMNQAKCGSIVISENNRPIGIWTESDALKLDLTDPKSFEIPIRNVMSAPIKTIHFQTPVGEAAVAFKKAGIHHYLVVDDEGSALGILSQSDVVLNQGAEFFLKLKDVRSALRDSPTVIQSTDLVRHAMHIMHIQKHDAAVVVYPDKTYGIITQRDIIRHLSKRRAKLQAGEIASKPLVSIPISSSLYYARNMLGQRQIRHLGVHNKEGELVGLLSFTEILSSIEHEYVFELKEALHQRDQALELSRRSLKLADKVFESTLEGIVITDAKGRIESVNPAFTRLTGYSAEEVLGKNPGVLSSGRQDATFYADMWRCLRESGQWQGEIWNRKKNGEIYLEMLTITGIRNNEGEYTHYAAIFSDITVKRQNEEKLNFLANHDALTSLPNRNLFTERLIQGINLARRMKTKLCVMFIDLDRFKIINDTLGHGAGDQLLQLTAARLSTCVRNGDTVARLGGDEFTIILENVRDIQEVSHIAQTIVDILAQRLLINGTETYSSGSVGISLYPNDAEDYETLLKNADTAMYQAKEAGKNQYRFFTASMNTAARERMEMESHLRRALTEGQFELHYQPKLDLKTHRLIGMEALVRWNHPERGMVSPVQFIPVAEEIGLIVPLGQWVLNEACTQTKKWIDQGFQLSVAVNISGQQFKLANPFEQVEAALALSGLSPENLEVEITESIAMNDIEMSLEALTNLRDLGVQVAIDDFGTGYSSLSYLRRMPLDTLKIDRSFIRDITVDADDAMIAQAIVHLAKVLSLHVVAEGIETEEQLNMLKEYACDCGQGYLFSKPLRSPDFEAFLKQNAADYPA